ncbi:dihydropyrimidinase [Polytolypa hystricis UAMH7299]|uniref:Dihydropyrimidinase n=1 Tax=Polytolypa hystricis (strain UAMH7299) TaxID=1447883 RepID=A0A2B7YF07_POLH7|nr:dihydropyrimidinase [Polytolypa hystricis UAMH7299]
MDSTYDLFVLNGTVVTTADIAKYDIAVKNGKIALLAPRGSLGNVTAEKVIDAQGGFVMPGGVDAHVHLAEPALFGGKGESSDDYESGSKSAIAGGTTTIVTFAPQEKTQHSLLEVVRETHARAANRAYCDYSFHLLISNPTTQSLAEFAALRQQEGISSLKIYMTYEALQLRDNQIMDVLLEARKQGITTMIHTENGDLLTWMTDQLEAHGHFAPKYHATSRPQLLESEATNRAIVLSAAKTIRDVQTRGLPVYAETCPQYLFLTRGDLAHPGFEGAKCVCSPPPREKADHEAIWTGLTNGTFTILSSDHCAFRYNDNEKGKTSVLSEEYPVGRFRYIPNGCPGIETRLPLVLGEGRLSPQKFVEVTATNPARLYGLYPRKGALIPGLSDADMTIWYP